MLNIYPFPEQEERSSDFEMTANGIPVPLHIARVSAFPVNRRWPGHQRSKDQTELAPFAMFSMDEPVRISLRPNRPFRNVVIRPLARKIDFTVADGVIHFTLEKPGFFIVHLDGYHKALHIFADPVKTYDVNKSSPDVLYYGPGVHEAGLIELHSHQTLFIDEGAVVYGRVHACEADNIRILGHGILDNSHEEGTILHEFGPEDQKRLDQGFAVQNIKRPYTIIFDFCRGIEIDGITIRDSLAYNICPTCCTDIAIRNLKTIGNWRYNSDGIDMHNCHRVRIRDCFLRTYDDSICVKGLTYYTKDKPEMLHYKGEDFTRFTDVVVERCVIWNDWGICLEIGAETRAEEICNITFRDCDIVFLQNFACDVQNVDDAVVHDVVFENIRIETFPVQRSVIQKADDQTFTDDPNPVTYVTACRCIAYQHPEYTSSGDTKHGINRDITFRDIAITGTVLPHCKFSGYGPDFISGPARMENVTFNGKKITSLKEMNSELGNYFTEVIFS